MIIIFFTFVNNNPNNNPIWQPHSYSPQDLMAIDYVPELINSGVQSFKIEGRLKGPEYVGLTTRAYREAVDKAWSTLHGQVLYFVPHRISA